MPERNYWLDLFTPQTWKEFQTARSTVSGFRESRWSTVQKIQKGDYLLCYLTGVSRWVGILEVLSNRPFKDNAPIWKDEHFPCRVKVKPIAELEPETGVPVKDMKDLLSAFKNKKTEAYSSAWTGKFRGSPAKWSQSDGEAVVRAVLSAKKSPINRPIDPIKLKYRARALETKIGLVTVPASEPVSSSDRNQAGEQTPDPTANT
jgi:predicted RNA-binding protein